MKKTNLLFVTLTAAGISCGLTANAQVNSLWQKAKDKATQKAGDLMDKKTSQPQDTGIRKSSKLTINSGFDFIAGDSVIFSEDFGATADGSSAHSFKTNGSSSVVSLKEIGGKWMSLQDNATYKLTKQLFYPRHFTLEFDILAVADQVKDIYPVVAGFTKDNSVRDYNSGDGAYLDLKYYNDNDIDVNSSYVQKYLNTRLDLNVYANQKMHVSMVVDGERMVVYIDKTKLADTQLFLADSPKNFYISGPMQYHNGAKVLVSNFKIAVFKKG